MHNSRNRLVDRAPAGEGGFSVAELLLGLLITSIVLAGALGVFDLSARAGRVQTQVAQMQQAMRSSHGDMLQLTRLAGRGGLDRGAFPDGVAVEVWNNVATGTEIAADETNSPVVAESTDVLCIRGVFETPLYQLNPASPNMTLIGNPVTEGEITIPNQTPSGIPLDLSPFEDAAGLPEAILLVGPLRDYAVVELKPNQSTFSKVGNTIVSATLKFRVTGGTHTAEYLTLTAGGVFPPTLASVAFVGILEEHRYYVRGQCVYAHAFARPGLPRDRTGLRQ